MAVDLTPIYRAIAENLAYDLRDPATGLALAELEARKDSLPGYDAWQKAFHRLMEACQIAKNPIRGGITAPKAPNGSGIAQMELSELEALIHYADVTIRPDGISSRADNFLAKFRAYGPLLQQVVCDRHLPAAGSSLERFWRKHVKELVRITEQPHFVQYKPFVMNVGRLATRSNFMAEVKAGTIPPAAFEVNNDMLAAQLYHKGPIGDVLRQFQQTLDQMFNIAKSSPTGGSQKHDVGQLETMKQEFNSGLGRDLQRYLQAQAKLTELCVQQATKGRTLI